MLDRLSEEDIESRKDSLVFYDYVEEFSLLDSEIDESGIALFDNEDNVSSIYRCESKDDTINTMKKVITVSELGEEEISKLNKIRYIIKVFLEICFRKKFSVFALSMAFIFMFFMGVKERIWVICLMYTWGFFTITEMNKAISFVKEQREEYKIHSDALLDEDVMSIVNKYFDDSVDDIKIYSLKKK